MISGAQLPRPCSRGPPGPPAPAARSQVRRAGIFRLCRAFTAQGSLSKASAPSHDHRAASAPDWPLTFHHIPGAAARQGRPRMTPPWPAPLSHSLVFEKAECGAPRKSGSPSGGLHPPISRETRSSRNRWPNRGPRLPRLPRQGRAEAGGRSSGSGDGFWWPVPWRPSRAWHMR
jgi:hypothetical protein